MIFISYRHDDQQAVREFAIKLSEAYGQENVFYDEWSIQPGDGIIDAMSAGLDRCRFFFFFVTKSSLASGMVKLEWQNALCKSANNEDIKFIPVRLAPCEFPSILRQTLYIDAYSQGLEVALRQMYDVINGQNTFRKAGSEFHNLTASINWESDSACSIKISATTFMEPTSRYCIILRNDPADIDYTVESDALAITSTHINFLHFNGIPYNCIALAVSRATTPEFPFRAKLSTKDNAKLDIFKIGHNPGNSNVWFLPVTQSFPQ